MPDLQRYIWNLYLIKNVENKFLIINIFFSEFKHHWNFSPNIIMPVVLLLDKLLNFNGLYSESIKQKK